MMNGLYSSADETWGSGHLDHVIVLGETHLRRIMSRYAVYYNQARTHLALEKDTPAARSIEPFGLIIAEPMVAGLHHRYARI